MLLGDVDENLENSDKYTPILAGDDFSDCDLGFFLAYAYCMLLLMMYSWKAIFLDHRKISRKNPVASLNGSISPGSKTLGKAGQIGRWLPQCHVNRQVSGLPKSAPGASKGSKNQFVFLFSPEIGFNVVKRMS